MYYSEMQDGAAGGPGGRGVLCFCAGRDAAPGLAGAVFVPIITGDSQDPGAGEERKLRL